MTEAELQGIRNRAAAYVVLWPLDWSQVVDYLACVDRRESMRIIDIRALIAEVEARGKEIERQRTVLEAYWNTVCPHCGEGMG